jgi:AraC-like DNA-binding protein
MPSVPLPIVIAFLLAILMVRVARYSDESWTRSALLAFVGVCALLAALVGLRWGYRVPFARFAQPIVASLLPPIAWLGFGGLRGSQNLTGRWAWLHAAPVFIVAVLAMVWRPLLDLALIGLFIGYGIALLRVALRDADSMGAVRIGDEAAASRATFMVALLMLAWGLIELIVAADFSFEQGRHADIIVAIENVIMLAVAGYAAAVAETSRPAPERERNFAQEPEPATSRQSPETSSDTAILAAIESAMHDRALYRDPNLTLDRLARRTGIPSRQISAAVNRVHSRNLSQVVNEYRVAEAAQLLRDTDRSITEIMLTSGFQTKSNFNREFRRVMGMSPTDYRRTDLKPATLKSPAVQTAATPPSKSG